jgi:integrase
MISIVLRERPRKKKTVIYFDIHCDGRRWYERLDICLTGNKEADKQIRNEAERLRAERLIQLSSGFDVTIRNKNFLEYYIKVKDERPEYERRAGVYKHLVRYCEMNKIKQLSFRDINEGFWNSFKNYLIKEAGHKPYTIYTVLSIVKAVLNRAVKEKLLLNNPLQYVREKRPKSTREFLTFDELQILKNTPCVNDEVKRAFLFACGTGLRLSDIENLKKENVKDEIKITMKKTKEVLILPYSPDILEYVPGFKNMRLEDKLFHLPARSIMSTVMKAWVQNSKIDKHITFHCARHTYATLHLTYGTHIEVLRDLLGHQDVRETQIYAKILDEKKKEAVKNLPKI